MKDIKTHKNLIKYRQTWINWQNTSTLEDNLVTLVDLDTSILVRLRIFIANSEFGLLRTFTKVIELNNRSRNVIIGIVTLSTCWYFSNIFIITSPNLYNSSSVWNFKWLNNELLECLTCTKRKRRKNSNQNFYSKILRYKTFTINSYN